MVEAGLESLELDLAIVMANQAVAALRAAQAERFAEAHPESYRKAWEKRRDRLGPMSAFFTNVLRKAKKLP